MRRFGIGTASPSNSVSTPAMIAQQARLAGAVQAQHADLGAGKERERDVLEDHALGRDDLAHAVHRVDVLSHGVRLPKTAEPALSQAGRRDAGYRTAAAARSLRGTGGLRPRARGYFFAAAGGCGRGSRRRCAHRRRRRRRMLPCATSSRQRCLSASYLRRDRRRSRRFFCAISVCLRARARRRCSSSSRSSVGRHRLVPELAFLALERRPCAW